MTTPAEDVAFWTLVAEESRRTVICHPSQVERLRALIAARGLDGRFDVVGSAHLPGENTVYVADERAARAALAELAQHAQKISADLPITETFAERAARLWAPPINRPGTQWPGIGGVS